MKFNGIKMKSLMKQHGWSQSELSRQAGVSQQVVSKLYRLETTNPTISVAASIASALGVSLSELLEEKEHAAA